MEYKVLRIYIDRDDLMRILIDEAIAELESVVEKHEQDGWRCLGGPQILLDSWLLQGIQRPGPKDVEWVNLHLRA